VARVIDLQPQTRVGWDHTTRFERPGSRFTRCKRRIGHANAAIPARLSVTFQKNWRATPQSAEFADSERRRRRTCRARRERCDGHTRVL